MLTNSNFRLAGALLSATLLVGCGAEGANDDDGPEVAEAGLAKDDAPRPVGTYDANPTGTGEFESLTLNANLTYEADIRIKIVCVRAPCNPPLVDGTYKYSHSGSTRYITLSGGVSGKYAYTVSGNTLRLRRTYTSTWFSLKRDTTAVPPYCGGPGETRARGGCPVGYTCNCPNGASCFVAGTCSPKGGETCGTKICGAGTVCCNPLMSICTPPGEFCEL